MGKLLLKRIYELTTPVGIYQHSHISKPDPKFGYALEDQARALIVANELKEKKLEKIYLNFIINAQSPNIFFNQYYYEKKGFVQDTTPTTVLDREEAYGITLWALYKTEHYRNQKIAVIVEKLTKESIKWSSPRAIASILLGLTSLSKEKPEENILVEKLRNFYLQTNTPEWKWFENYLTYANAIIPWSLWERFISRKDLEAKKIAEITTKFLIDTCQVDGIPAPIGNKNWYFQNNQKSLFDQQPIDAAYMVCCLEKAFLATKDNYYFEWAKNWWNWFWGNNIKHIPLVDENLYCYDGLTPNGVNLNQGAESNICFVMAALAAIRLKIWKLE